MNNISNIIDSLGDDLLEDFSANIHSELEAIEQHIMNIGNGLDVTVETTGLLRCIEGIKTNIPLHQELFHDSAFQTGGTNIHYLEKKLGL